MGDCDKDSSEYLFDELAFFQPRDDNGNELYLVVNVATFYVATFYLTPTNVRACVYTPVVIHPRGIVQWIGQMLTGKIFPSFKMQKSMKSYFRQEIFFIYQPIGFISVITEVEY